MKRRGIEAEAQVNGNVKNQERKALGAQKVVFLSWNRSFTTFTISRLPYVKAKWYKKGSGFLLNFVA